MTAGPIPEPAIGFAAQPFATVELGVQDCFRELLPLVEGIGARRIFSNVARNLLEFVIAKRQVASRVIDATQGNKDFGL